MSKRVDRRLAVKLVRGPVLSLASHPDHASDDEELLRLCARIRTEQPGTFLAADLFSGAGGLSLGLQQAGIQTVLAADHDPDANATHAHHFPGLTVDWDLSDRTVIERVARLMRAAKVDVLAGGPPCQPFSKAGRSGIRFRVRQGSRDPLDSRRDLWMSFLEVAQLARPRAVIMENVPDMALDREMLILRSMVLALERIGYAVETRIVQTSDYGVPQYRQRLILVAVAHGMRFDWPAATNRPVTLRQAIGDLPQVEGGWRPAAGAQGWTEYGLPVTSFQREMRRGVSRKETHHIYDHITRPVRDDDRAAFDLMDGDTRYSQLPPELRRYRADIFDDKYKRLEYDRVSRTITAHIAKDGYWYIHPEQNRTLTVREAARVQTFPDWFRFAGTPTAAFRQIGNAVPPRLGQALGEALCKALDHPEPARSSRESIGFELAAWWMQQPHLSSPWLRDGSRWQVIMAEHLLDRCSDLVANSIWPILARWRTPEATAASSVQLRLVGTWLCREGRVEDLLTLGAHLVPTGPNPLADAALGGLVKSQAINPGIADIAALAGNDHGEGDEEPVIVTQAALRVASRVLGETSDRKNKLTDGRLAVARLIGFGELSRNAHLAVLEIGRSLCSPMDPECISCPLRAQCEHARVHYLA